jgi:large subunit ribosomal protein L23
MALFGKKTKKVEDLPVPQTMSRQAGKAPEAVKPEAVKPEAVKTAAKVGVSRTRTGMASSVIIRPRVTEKSHTLAEDSNVYVFNVRQGATKGMVKEAVKELYKISPVKVSIMPIPKKSRFVRGRKGTSGGGRKAYVYVKKGEKLDIS